MAEEECVSAGDFREAWERWGGGRGEGGTRIPLYCDSSVLREAVKMGRVEGGKGDDSRSVAHQVSLLYCCTSPAVGVSCCLFLSWEMSRVVQESR